MYDPHTHSFILKVWLEEQAEGEGRSTWRGVITHVPSGERCYYSTLDDMAAFVARFLTSMGVHLSPIWGVRQWWRQRKKRTRG